MVDPYDELLYESIPVEWTAPERMAATSKLHGGPMPPVEGYRYVELGCGDATNLLPLARYRPKARFVGVDGSAALMAAAHAGRDAIGARNLALVQGRFEDALADLEGPFDYVVLHGVFSWVDDATRDALLAFAARALSPTGLLYASYNALPGWSVRGLVRDFLRAHSRPIDGLRARARTAREAAARMADVLQRSDHPYSRLMAGEFAFVRDAKESYVAHEFLAETNRAYWQSEFRALLERNGLVFVADADFAYPSARLPEGLGPWIDAQGLAGRALCDTIDLMCFAQFRCALACRAEAPREPWRADAIRGMRIVSRMVLGDVPSGSDDAERPLLKTSAGHEVRFDNEDMRRRFIALEPGVSYSVDEAFPQPEDVADDLVLLHRNGAIELRLWDSPLPPCPILSARERSARGEFTSPQHLRVAAPLPPGNA
ncbi:MAG TPA: methyltransferase [Polyangiaceae bacterium]|nr:methyltransferase [Polyangiaceae bacterium]